MTNRYWGNALTGEVKTDERRPTGFTPLTVIDYSNVGRVGKLVQLYLKAFQRLEAGGNRVTAMQRALEELGLHSLPAEPDELGFMVEDGSGDFWVRQQVNGLWFCLTTSRVGITWEGLVETHGVRD